MRGFFKFIHDFLYALDIFIILDLIAYVLFLLYQLAVIIIDQIQIQLIN